MKLHEAKSSRNIERALIHGCRPSQALGFVGRLISSDFGRIPTGRGVVVTFFVLSSLVISSTMAWGQPPTPQGPDFQAEILPILADRCFSCHGPDNRANESGLRLDLRDEAVGELPSGDGRAIFPGQPRQSEILNRIRHADRDLLMPPPSANRKPISEAEYTLLEAWIAAGATYRKHWSFESLPQGVVVPEVGLADWSKNEIDRFVLSRLEQLHLRPSPQSERWRWLRRVSLDLTGLPPTREACEAFEKDASPEAYEKVVDGLLASPAFGEHMAVPWLDVARYGDSYGYQSDQLCQVWPYRDFVVEAFNRNLPYDQFITWQLAGDLLPSATREQRIATAFNRLHRQTNEGGSLDEEWRAEYAADRVHTFGTAFLGLTLECGRCHDHKFDPISTRDYYQLAAFFNSIDEYGTYNDSAHVPTPTLMLFQPETEEKISALRAQLADLRALRKEKGPTPNPPLGQLSPEAEFDSARDSPKQVIPWASYSLDSRNEKSEFPASESDRAAANSSGNNREVDGFEGKALQFSGDDGLGVPAFSLSVHQSFSLTFRLRLPADFRNGMVWHQTSGTDTGFSGTEMNVVAGRLRLAMVRFWPGNAIAIETRDEVPRETWVQVIASYDGSGTAAGLRIWVDGRLDCQTTRDHLYKSPNGGDRITFGERFRTLGLTQGAIDDLRVYQECVRPGENGEVQSEPEAASADTRALVQQLFQLYDSTPELMVMEELPRPRDTFVLERGRYDAPKTADRRVDRGVPVSIAPWPENAPHDRLGLAQWLTAPDHPLTARVAVNRIWQNFFGKGLVETAEDFGVQGTRPSHPELLDWLARDFVNHGWDVKRVCRQIALSATYRQSSQATAEARQADPSNRQLGRGPSQRLSAEQVRDLALFASGLIDLRSGGPPVSPIQPEGLWTESNSMSPAYHQSVDRDRFRRSLYSVWKRTAPLPNMLAFDAPGREVCLARRSLTGTPSQALVLLNDPEFVRAALAAADRALRNSDWTDEQRFSASFEDFSGRKPTGKEIAILLETLAAQLKEFQVDVAAARKFITLSGKAEVEKLSDEEVVRWGAWGVAMQTILNGDAAVWKR